jgi:hypothetical protein
VAAVGGVKTGNDVKHATTNTGVLHCVQDDGENKQRRKTSNRKNKQPRKTATAKQATADSFALLRNDKSNRADNSNGRTSNDAEPATTQNQQRRRTSND